MENWIKAEIKTNGAPQNTGLYSQGLTVGPLIYVSGQGPLDPETGEIVEGTIEQQTLLTFKNIEAILAEAGSTLQDVVKVSVHLQDINDFSRFSKTYESLFPGDVKPVRTTVGSQLVGIKVEADVVAFLQSRL